ncbi:hypothetical protein AMS68_003771 [Peltaster fructicola]|uniref:Nucleoside phosphorylase domain-containing protein n=1 Tax=Peltaster fructicola TaxID=286661 RepID=A0A6H0XU45_9PEZI|nr:hypothetical protein AMS68_003771 [Peltaster fructicola]
MPTNPRTWDDYTFGIICPLPHERMAAEAMLDEHHAPIANQQPDDNRYTFGRIGPHNVAITSLREGERGQSAAARVAATFRWMRYNFVVGTASGIPRPHLEDGDIRLGDIVVGAPERRGVPAVIEYCSGWAEQDGLRMLPSFTRPSFGQAQAIHGVTCGHAHNGPTHLTHLANVTRKLRDYAYPALKDALFDTRDPKREIARPQRHGDRFMPDNLTAPFIRQSKDGYHDYPMVHYGTIASADMTVRGAGLRDQLHDAIQAQLGLEALCLTREAGGVLHAWDTALVIQGICDYADSHKDGRWENFAAAAAAAYMKDIILQFNPKVGS